MFAIDTELCITYSPDPIAEREDIKTFSTLPQFARLLEGWTRPQLAALWNSFAGAVPFSDLKPVKAFTHSPTDAIRRIWEAIQRLNPEHREAVQEAIPSETVQEPKKSTVRKARKTKTKAAPSPKAASKAKNRGKGTKEPAAARPGSKKEMVISMISRRTGASAEELMDATGWQAHTLRGAISTMNAKGVLATRTEKIEKRGTVYYSA